MTYVEKQYRCGAVIEVVRYVPREYRKTLPKEERRKKTKEEIDKANAIQAKQKLVRKINANFRPGDLFVTLTYPSDGRPSPEEAKKILKHFINKLRRLYRKAGAELKYIIVTEFENKAIHHHMIANNIRGENGSGSELISQCWKHSEGKGAVRFESLYDDGDYEKLAEYLLKETEKTVKKKETAQRYTCSRNLVNPKPEKITRKIKAARWNPVPVPKKGYHIKEDSVYLGSDTFGFDYMHYYMVKDKPTDADWENIKPERIRKRRRKKKKKTGGG